MRQSRPIVLELQAPREANYEDLIPARTGCIEANRRIDCTLDLQRTDKVTGFY
jgi:hypothetical protein